jgi:hypothetical protein
MQGGPVAVDLERQRVIRCSKKGIVNPEAGTARHAKRTILGAKE